MFKFYVVVNNKTGYFFKKYHYKYSLSEKVSGDWTPILGRARIFESPEIALMSIPKWDESNWINTGIASVREMIADYV